MSFQQGYKARVLHGATDYSTYTRNVSYSRARELIDVTTLQPGSSDPVMSLMAGLGSSEVTFDGLWDPDSGASDAVIATATDGAEDVVTVSFEGATAIGQTAIVMNVIQNTAPIGNSPTDAVTLSTGKQGTGTSHGGVILHHSNAETSTGNFASVDNSASTSNGAIANLHVTAFTGTNATIKVTDSTNDSTFADHITFTTVTGTTSEQVASTGTVNRYARVELTGTFTTITFVVSFARLNV